MKILIEMILIGLLFQLQGCGHFSGTTLEIDQVHGDFWSRSIGNNNIVLSGSTAIQADTPGIPTESIPPVTFDFGGRGAAQWSKVVIHNVSGSVFFDSALEWNQGVDVPGSLEKLFIPGNPFAVTRK